MPIIPLDSMYVTLKINSARLHQIFEDRRVSGAFVLCEISILTEPALGHLHYLLTDVPPQPNSPPPPFIFLPPLELKFQLQLFVCLLLYHFLYR